MKNTDLSISKISEKLNVDRENILQIIEKMLIANDLENEYKLDSISDKIKEYSFNSYIDQSIAFRIASKINMKRELKDNFLVLENNPYAHLIFEYSCEQVDDISFSRNAIINLSNNLIIDYNHALEYVTLFETRVKELSQSYTVTIVNLNEDILVTYKTIFDYVANGGSLVYHDMRGIPKKLYGNKKYLPNAKKELLCDLEYCMHGDIVFIGTKIKREEYISMLILQERLKLLCNK